MRRLHPSLVFILITLMLDVLGIGLVIPVSPRLIEELRGMGDAESAPMVAIFNATYAAMQFIFAPILGSLSDRIGRRPVILIALLGSGLDYFAMAYAHTIPLLLITRAINGISGANISAASAYIADITPPEKRAVGFGMMGAAFGVGFVVGPLVGGLLGAHNIRWPFMAAGALTLANWLYGAFVLPESLPADRRRPFSWKRANPVGAFAALRRYPLAFGIAMSLFLINVAQFGLHATWVLYTKHRYGWDTKAVGYSLFLVGIGAVIVQGGLARRLIPRLGEPRSVLIGLMIGILSMTGYGLANHGWMIYAIIAVASIGAIAGPASQSLITRSVRPDEQGEIQGAMTSLQSVAGVVGPLIGGNLLGKFAAENATIQIPGMPFFAGAALTTLALINAAVVLKKFKAPPPTEQVMAPAAH